MNACKKSLPEPMKEHVYRVAFQNAFRSTRAAYGYFGVCFIFGTEFEMLEHLTNQILKREVIDDFIVQRAKSNPSQAKAVALSVHNETRKIVKPIVASTWRFSFMGAETLKASFELTVKASLRSLLDVEEKVVAYLRPKIDELVQPYLSEYQTVVCEPLLTCCYDDILAAYEQALLGFHSEVHKILHSVDRNVDAILGALKTAERVIDSTGGPIGPLAHAHRILWAMHTDHLVQLQDLFDLAGMRGYDVYSSVMDDLRTLLRNGIFTYSIVCFPFDAAKGTDKDAAQKAKMRNVSTGTATEDDIRLLRDSIARSIDARAVSVDSGSAVPASPTSDSSPKQAEGEDGANSSSAESSPTPHRSSPEKDLGGTPAASVVSKRSASTGAHGSRRKSSVNKLHSQSHRVDVKFLGQVLQEVSILLGMDAKRSFHQTLTNVLLDMMESHIQETIIAQCYDVVLSAQHLLTRDTSALIYLEAIGERMVRYAVKEFALALTAERIGDGEHRLDFHSFISRTAVPAVASTDSAAAPDDAVDSGAIDVVMESS